MQKLLLAAAALALTACASTPDEPTGPSAVWLCDQGARFAVTLTSGGNAQVSAGGETYRLAGVRAASGTRYVGGGVEFWEHGEEAMLNGARGGPYDNCVPQPTGS